MKESELRTMMFGAEISGKFNKEESDEPEDSDAHIMKMLAERRKKQ